MIIQFVERRAFDPFDRLAQHRESQGKSLDELLDEFASLRVGNLDELRRMSLRHEHLRRRECIPLLA